MAGPSAPFDGAAWRSPSSSEEVCRHADDGNLSMPLRSINLPIRSERNDHVRRLCKEANFEDPLASVVLGERPDPIVEEGWVRVKVTHQPKPA